MRALIFRPIITALISLIIFPALASADNARIDGDSIIVWSDKVDHPVAVRYGWANNPEVNLYNKANLPAETFRTDNWPGVTRMKK